jgi:hypothetical protein
MQRTVRTVGTNATAVILVLVVCFLLGNSPPSEFYMPKFRNTLFHIHRQVGVCSFHTHLPAYEDGTDGVFRNIGI